jgi:DNA-binding Lrp family transcriptional regulator
MKKSLFLNEEMMRLHRLIKKRSTGTPAQLAQKLDCSLSTVYNRIRELREAGLPINYCAATCCYYYDGEVSVEHIVRLNGEEMKKIIGGNGHSFIKSNP